jgi:hypothetical protein
MSTRRRARPKRLFAKLLLILFGILVGAIIGEVALRVAGFSYPEFYQLDESRGYALRPGMAGWYRKEGEAYVQINSDGLHDRGHSKRKPDNTLRIAVIGDSYPEALPVSASEAFWGVMERKLQECGDFAGRKIEVINFGVSGYGTAQELITLREHVWDYSPDVVMLTVTTNNDVADNSRALKKTDEIPYFVYRDGKLVLDDSFRESRAFVLRQSAINRFGRWLKDYSRLVQAINQAHHGFKILLASWKTRLKSSSPQGSPALHSNSQPAKSDVVGRSEELGIDNVVYLEPSDAVWNDAWQVTEGLIVAMRDEVKSRGAKFVVVTLSSSPQVLPDRDSRESFMRRFGISDLFYPDNRIKSLGNRENIQVVTLAPDLQAYAESNRVFLHGFGTDIGNGHWNSEGHRVAGELIAEKLCAVGSLK